MNEFLIKEYVERLTKEDITKFAKTQGVTLETTESDIIYEYIKKHWRTFYYGNPKELLNELKEKLNSDTYNKLELLYVQAKNIIN